MTGRFLNTWFYKTKHLWLLTFHQYGPSGITGLHMLCVKTNACKICFRICVQKLKKPTLFPWAPDHGIETQWAPLSGVFKTLWAPCMALFNGGPGPGQSEVVQDLDHGIRVHPGGRRP